LFRRLHGASAGVVRPVPDEPLLAALAALPGFDADRVDPAGLELRRSRENRGRVAHAPFLDHRLAVDIDPVAVLGGEAEAVGAGFGRLDETRPADGAFAAGAAPLDVGPFLHRGFRRRAFEIAVGEVLGAQAGLRADRIDAKHIAFDGGFRRAYQPRALHVVDLALREAGLDAVEHRDRVRRRAVVVADQGVEAVGVRAQDGDPPRRALDGQQVALVLEKDHRGAGHFE